MMMMGIVARRRKARMLVTVVVAIIVSDMVDECGAVQARLALGDNTVVEWRVL